MNWNYKWITVESIDDMYVCMWSQNDNTLTLATTEKFPLLSFCPSSRSSEIGANCNLWNTSQSLVLVSLTKTDFAD